MAYGALPVKAAGDVFDLTAYNLIKGNFEAGVPDIFTTKGDLAVGTAANAAARLAVGTDTQTLVADSTTTTGLAWTKQPSCRVIKTSTTDPTVQTWVTITFDSEASADNCFDNGEMWEGVTNPGHITVPTGGAGIYLVGATVEFNSFNNTPDRDIGIRIRHEDATVLASTTAQCGTGDSIDMVLSVLTLCYLDVGEHIDLQVYTYGDISINHTDNYSPVFWAAWQRRA